jgi:hypothetical protein
MAGRTSFPERVRALLASAATTWPTLPSDICRTFAH